MAQEIDILLSEKSFSSLKDFRSEMKRLREGLLNAQDAEQANAYAKRLGEMKDRMKDVNEQVQIFTAGSKFEQAGNAIKGIVGDIGNMDFEGAAAKAKSLSTIIQSIKFSEIVDGAKQLLVSLKEMAAAALANPLAWIAAATAALVFLLDKLGVFKILMDSMAPIFNSISRTIDSMAKSIRDFTDSLGWTKYAQEDALKRQKELFNEAKKLRDMNKESLIDELATTNEYSIATAERIAKLKNEREILEATDDGSLKRKKEILEKNKAIREAEKDLADNAGLSYKRSAGQVQQLINSLDQLKVASISGLDGTKKTAELLEKIYGKGNVPYLPTYGGAKEKLQEELDAVKKFEETKREIERKNKLEALKEETNYNATLLSETQKANAANSKERENDAKAIEAHNEKVMSLMRKFNVDRQTIEDMYTEYISEHRKATTKEQDTAVEDQLQRESDNRETALKQLESNNQRELSLIEKFHTDRQTIDNMYSEYMMSHQEATAEEVYSSIEDQLQNQLDAYEEYTQAMQAIDEAYFNAKNNLLQASGNALSAAFDLNKEINAGNADVANAIFLTQKAVEIGTVWMKAFSATSKITSDVAAANTAALVMAGGNPLAAAPMIAANTAFGAKSIAMTNIAAAVQTAAIAAVTVANYGKYNASVSGGGSKGSGVSGGVSGGATPAIALYGSPYGGNQQNASTGEANSTNYGGSSWAGGYMRQAAPVQAYVVETQLSAVQARAKMIASGALLGP